ncbi:putative F-box/kelch-repeat protein At3g17570 [Chenopodium quinoa]|uniref:putative F-box/kelch-repeat protein At3g17570 n=1 Tax=Chenopodium quinoa TaxID=63459 RepID=UPI000B781788|nr:putative F-box/kelch-repeat protein At3g17570 [Chenopodium quinoa]
MEDMDLCLLNTDISYNILSRLPADILVQLKMVSKGWQHFIADPDFMRLQMKMAEPILISGYFFQEKYLYCDIDVEKLSYIPIKAKETKIYQNILEFLPEKVTILGSSNGLVCCRSCIPSPDPLIYICNPVSKKWMTVKWDRINRKDYIAFSFEPSSTSSMNENTDYNLVRVFEVDVHTPGKEEFYFTFETYNWERRVWVKSKEICHCEDSLCITKYVLVKGILYWLTDGHILLMFDIANELSLLITLPIPFTEGKLPEICLGESDGELHCVVVSPEGLMIWALEDCFSSNWDLRSFISFEVMEEENPQYLCNLAERVSTSVGEKVPWMQLLAFKDGKLFLRVSNSAYSFDIQTRRICFLCDMLDLGHEFVGATVVPYSVTMASVADS